jgi:hypothetical protein
VFFRAETVEKHPEKPSGFPVLTLNKKPSGAQVLGTFQFTTDRSGQFAMRPTQRAKMWGRRDLGAKPAPVGGTVYAVHPGADLDDAIDPIYIRAGLATGRLRRNGPLATRRSHGEQLWHCLFPTAHDQWVEPFYSDRCGDASPPPEKKP